MKEDLAKHGIAVFALSKDDVRTAAKQRERDGLSFTVLSDPKLAVIRQFGLEHHKAIEFSTGAFTLFGLPLALFPSIKTMAIPTTLLIDEEGVVRWIDQAEDSRIRSNSDRVLGAVEKAFD